MFEGIPQKLNLLRSEWSPNQASEINSLLDRFVAIRGYIQHSLEAGTLWKEEPSFIIVQYINYWEQLQELLEGQIARWKERAAEHDVSESDRRRTMYDALMREDRLIHDIIEQIEFLERCLKDEPKLSSEVTAQIGQAIVRYRESWQRLSAPK